MFTILLSLSLESTVLTCLGNFNYQTREGEGEGEGERESSGKELIEIEFSDLI